MGIPYEEFLRRFQATIADLPHAEQLQAMEDLAAVSLKGLPKEYLQALRRRLAKELDRPHGHGEQGVWAHMVDLIDGDLALRGMGLIEEPPGK
jgi:hypothetical protein